MAKLTPEVHDRICALVRAGNTTEVAAAAAGVSASSVYHWRREHDAFRRALERARAEAEVSLEAQLAMAARRGSWRAAATLLER